MQSTGTRGTRNNVDLKRRENKLMTIVVSLELTLITVLPNMLAESMFLVRNMLKVANYDLKLQLFGYYYLPVELMNFMLNPIVYAWR